MGSALRAGCVNACFQRLDSHAAGVERTLNWRAAAAMLQLSGPLGSRAKPVKTGMHSATPGPAASSLD
jgi:hypothetical protein